MTGLSDANANVLREVAALHANSGVGVRAGDLVKEWVGVPGDRAATEARHKITAEYGEALNRLHSAGLLERVRVREVGPWTYSPTAAGLAALRAPTPKAKARASV